LHRYDERQIDGELSRAEEAIERATGQRPRGFRGPGFSVSRATLEALARRGYRYDASIFPTFLGPLARAYYFRTARLSPEQRRQREALYGTLADGLRPLNPYCWDLGGTSLCEVPVTTLPGLRIPIHMSYLLYLAVFEARLAMLYFRAAMRLCRATRTQVSLLLHPLDFVGCDDTGSLSFFPAMNLVSAHKVRLVNEMLQVLTSFFTVVTVNEHAERVSRIAPLPMVTPCFSRT